MLLPSFKVFNGFVLYNSGIVKNRLSLRRACGETSPSIVFDAWPSMCGCEVHGFRIEWFESLALDGVSCSGVTAIWARRLASGEVIRVWQKRVAAVGVCGLLHAVQRETQCG